ncbi:MAG: hypothetical protein IPK83_11445 [Planctomycetes bacterium]|nr:hypothetical protein [Planctomycetota bacterium]
MFRLFGQITGDPDFDLLRVTAGTDFGLPSPGHTTLTQLPGGNWAVDSFFYITYRIDFVGAPGSVLAGMSGSTTGTIRMGAGTGPSCEGNCPAGTICNEVRTVNADGTMDICCECVPINQACCLPTGACVDVDAFSCTVEFGGTPQGIGTTCATANCNAAECSPTPNGDACNPSPCPGEGQICLPTCINYDPNTGQSTVVSCDCRDELECHAVIQDGGNGDGDGEVTPHGGGNPCVVADAGGTVTLPPAGCAYLSPDDVHMILDGLPAGTTLQLAPIHTNFICGGPAGTQGVCHTLLPPTVCEDTGGVLGGNFDCFESDANFTINGTGTLAGFNRTALIPLSCEVVTAPRTPGDAVQSFDTDMFRMFGQITGDPDFDLLRVTGGTDFGLPSPGHTTLTQLPGGNWAVDSFFDITYRIDFVGAPGGPLAGMSGSTTATIRMATGSGPACQGVCPPGTVCREVRTVQADGSITVCCVCEPISTTEACCLPNAACVDVDAVTCADLGGIAQGPGTTCATTTCNASDCNPTPNGDGCNPFPCPNDGHACVPVCAVFDPTTGQTLITVCECKFDDACQIRFAPGSAPGGGPDGGDGPRGGGNPCVVADNGGGTVSLPPAGCDYLSPTDVHEIIDGLPPGTTIQLAPIHTNFICHEQSGNPGVVCTFNPPPGVCEVPGGTFSGQRDCFDSDAQFTLTGTGALAGFNRTAILPLQCEVHTAPRLPGQPVQSFDTDMFRMFGQITGDPDFDLLRVTGGTDFGLPSPGHTTLTQLPGGNWAVDSFFDITYRIDFVAAPGGPLAGMSGSTTATIRMATGGGAPSCEGVCPPGTTCREVRTLLPDGRINVCCVCEPYCACPGDVYADGVLNGKDIQAFVDCLLGVGAPGALINCACVDFDNNGPSMSDVPQFVQAILTKQPCSPTP